MEQSPAEQTDTVTGVVKSHHCPWVLTSDLCTLPWLWLLLMTHCATLPWVIYLFIFSWNQQDDHPVQLVWKSP